MKLNRTIVWVIVCGALLIAGIITYSFISNHGIVDKKKMKITEKRRLGLNVPPIEPEWIVKSSTDERRIWAYDREFNTPNKPEHIRKVQYFADSVLLAEKEVINFNRKKL
ncbi:MAG: hypothetical protein ABJN36_02055 [Cyclobacteriaceae bacterium]